MTISAREKAFRRSSLYVTAKEDRWIPLIERADELSEADVVTVSRGIDAARRRIAGLLDAWSWRQWCEGGHTADLGVLAESA
jgi:hypothetical protein